MMGQFVKALRTERLRVTQAELARALEVSPVTLNRWENDDPRYKPSDKDRRLLEALDELVGTLKNESAKAELRDVLHPGMDPPTGINSKPRLSISAH